MSKKISEQDIYNSFKGVISDSDKVIILYSAIYSFAHKLNWEISQSANNILDILLDVIGSKRTLIIPSYFHDFSHTRKYDLSLSSTSNGLLSNAALRRKDMYRTHNPLQSYLVYGSRKEELIKIKTKTSWGKSSVMGWLCNNNAKIINLGLPWHKACSLLHFSEELKMVPYRYFKRFSGKMYDNGNFIGDCEEVMYCKSLKFTPIWQYENIFTELRSNNFIISISDSVIPIEASYAQDYLSVTNQMIDENPYAYVKNALAVKNWVNNFKQLEMDSLSPDERYQKDDK